MFLGLLELKQYKYWVSIAVLTLSNRYTYSQLTCVLT